MRSSSGEGLLLGALLVLAGCATAQHRDAAAQEQRPDADAAVRRVLETQRISFDFRDRGLEDVVAELRERSRLNIFLDLSGVDDERACKVTLRVDDLPLGEALSLALKLLHFGYTIENGTLIVATTYALDARDPFRHQKEWWAEAQFIRKIARAASKDMSAEVFSQLKDRKLSMGFSEAPLLVVVEFLRESTHLQILVDETQVCDCLQMKVTARVEDAAVGPTLAEVLKKLGLGYYVDEGVVFITSGEEIQERERSARVAERLAAALAAPENRETRVKLENTKIDLDFTDASLEDILEFVHEYAKVDIKLEGKVRAEGTAEKKITFQMRDAVLENALNLLLRQYGLTCTLDRGSIVITRESE